MSLEAVLRQPERGLWELQFGARTAADGATMFRVWAPRAQRLSVKIMGRAAAQTISMARTAEDIFETVVPETHAGADYLYVIDDEKERPDPVSRWQPEGVHGPSRVIAPGEFVWTDQSWRGLPLKDFLIYELHTGTFTPEGTFEAIIPRLSHLTRLGITAVELMPVAEFPGGRNWGYDGAYLYAPQSTYGGPQGLKKLIDACHAEGLAVVMDVVYNHLGPEGNYLGEYAPLFSQCYRTPWGDALNFDGPEADGVRRFFIDNALYWLTEYHIDALRLDAIHRIIDNSPRHILEEIGEEFQQQAARLNRSAWVIAESDLNDVRVINPVGAGGYGLDAQWSDDFHHSLHALVTGTTRGYFADFGRMADLGKAITEGFVYDGRRSVFRKKRHGTSSAARPAEQFVICIQNHDQIANSYWGERLGRLVSPEQQKLAAALLLCAPNLPLLFMGQEWGEVAPFFYFTSHTDPVLARGVREGRREEYADFVNEGEAEDSTVVEEYADPQSPNTFEESKLVWSRLETSPHGEIFRYNCDLIAIRKRYPCLSNCDKKLTRASYDEHQQWMVIERGDAPTGVSALLLCNLSAELRTIPLAPAALARSWRRILWSDDPQYGGDPRIAAPPATLQGGGDRGATGGQLSSWSAVLYIESK